MPPPPASKNKKQSRSIKAQHVSDNQTFGDDDKNSITFEGLDPVLGTLGIMIGLLSKVEGQPETYKLEPHWFTDPYGISKAGINKNTKDIGKLLGELLGNVGGNAIGAPEKDPAILGTWYPIQKKEGKDKYVPTGLYLVSIDNKVKDKDGKATDEDLSNAIGIGVLKKWEVIKGLKVEVWANIPLIVMDKKGSFNLTFLDDDNINPVTIGIAFEGTDPENPIIDENHITFNGVKFNTNFFLQKKDPRVNVSLEILGLQLANDDAPRNYSLADIEAITPLEILDTVVNLFTGALGNQFTDKKKELAYLAPLFGFSSRVPDSDVKLPLMEWIQLFEYAAQKKDASIPFFNWFNALSATPDILKAWMTCFSGFLGTKEGDSFSIIGQGTRSQPFQVPVIAIGKVGQVNLTIGTTVVGDGTRYFYPGLSFTSASLQLATSKAYFNIEADLELAKFILGTTNKDHSDDVSLELNFITNFNISGKDDGLLLSDVQGISLGKLSGGLAIGALTGKIVPHFELINLTLPPQFSNDDTDDEIELTDAEKKPNEFGVVNLLSPDQLAGVGAVALSGELQKLILGEEEDPGGFRRGIAVLIGLIEPKSAPKDWTTPPFGEEGIITSIKDPIHAWASYYLNILESKDQKADVRPFTYILESFAEMLQVKEAKVEVKGGGTAKSPWSVGLTVSGTDMPAHLTAYEVITDNNTELVFGVNLAPEIVLAGVKIIPSLNIDAVHIVLEHDKPAAATWLHKVEACLCLPEHIETPKIGDIVVGVEKAQLSAGWYQKGGWNWSILVEQPSLKIGKSKAIVGADLDFDAQSTWMDLVDESAATFGPFFAAAAGIGLMKTETRTGLLATAMLGLLTDFSAFPIFQNSGLKWSGFKGIQLTSFKDPLLILRNQVISNFDTVEKSKSLLSLIAWTISNDEKAPSIVGDGTFLLPFQLPLFNSVNIPVWFDKTTSVIGFGLANNLNYNYKLDGETLEVDVATRLNVVEYNLQKGALENSGNAPSILLEAVLSNSEKGKHLINLPDHLGFLDKLILGFELSLKDGDLQFEPIVSMINAQLAGQTTASDISLVDYKKDDLALQTAFLSILNSALQYVFDHVKKLTLFQSVYDLLAIVGVTIPADFDKMTKAAKDADEATLTLGINSGGWQSLISDPLKFIEKKLIAFLESPKAYSQIVKLVNQLTGFKLPEEPIPLPILQLLSGLGIVGSEDVNFAFSPHTFLSIISNPVEELKKRFVDLVTDDAKRKALAKNLVKDIPKTKIGLFCLTSNTNGLVCLSTDQPFTLGEVHLRNGKTKAFLEFGFNVTLSFTNDQLSIGLISSLPSLELALHNKVSIKYDDNKVVVPIPEISVVWGIGDRPSAAPFIFLPIPKGTDVGTFYLDQFATLAPAYAANVILNAIFESELLKKYPVVQQIFKMLGIANSNLDVDATDLAIKKGSGADFRMGSIIGLITHPLDWLLSDDVLGTNGKFDILKFVGELAKIPKKSFTPKKSKTEITIGPNPSGTGVTLTGLPYSFYVEISGDTTRDKEVAKFCFGCKEISIVDDIASINNLIFCVNVTRDYQAAVEGGVSLATKKAGLHIDFLYDNDFSLSLGSGSPGTQKGPHVQFLPFAGWGALVGQTSSLAATKIIEKVVPVLLDKLEPKAEKFVEAMRTFGKDVPVDLLLKKIATIISDDLTKDPEQIGHDIEVAALCWLKNLFDETNGQLTKTLDGVLAIFENIPEKIGKVTKSASSEGLLQFTPGDVLPIVIYFGLDNNKTTKKKNIGLWVGLTIPKIKYLNISVLRTGLGVDLATLQEIDFDFGAKVIVPLDDKVGPGLSLQKDSKTGFSLVLDPLADTTPGSDPSKLAIELVPILFAQDGKKPKDLDKVSKEWILNVLKYVLPRYVSVLVLNNKYIKPWLEYNLFEPLEKKYPKLKIELSAIDILIGTTLVITKEIEGEGGKKKSEYLLNSIDAISKITPIAFVSHLLLKLLDHDPPVPIVEFGDGGIISIGVRPKGDAKENEILQVNEDTVLLAKEEAKEYGIVIQAPDLKIKSAPNIVIQLGATDGEWIKETVAKDSIEASLPPGIQFYVPITDNGNNDINVNFKNFNIILGNVGLDIVGKNGQPLVDLTRFKLGGIEPRILLDVRFLEEGGADVVFGGNLTLADMGLSLVPGKLDESKKSGEGKKGDKSNPIASNLLGSASEGDDDKKNETPNPTFSVQAAYTQNFSKSQGKFWVNLSSSTSEGKKVIFPIQRSFGPLFIDDLGVGWNDKDVDKPLLDILFSGNVKLAGLKIDLIGLDIGIPVKTPADLGAYSIELAGMDVSYKGGPVTINGGLIKEEDPLQYIGGVVVKAAAFSIMAVGAYAQIPNNKGENVTSLFIFGALDIPLGGPPVFFVTGLAAGFGFNRSLKIPSIEGVMNFPLITGVLNGTLTSETSPKSGLKALGDLVAPKIGEYWLAAGLKFRSFELVNTAALLFIKFGKEFEIDILGLSYAALPPGMSKDNALAYFELAIKIAIKPSAGVISVEAQLTPNSYVLTKDCKVTGGFAFYLWFKNTTQMVDGKSVPVPKGQFVITLGGYHPRFKAPAYYPKVPRLGLMWKMDFAVGKLSISGGVYFAICPTAVMAGAYLDAVFEAGPLKAWLKAYANFLIEWKPFYFDVGIGITVGVSFGFKVAGVRIAISAELGAKLELQGPPVSGQVVIDWYVISFTIPFGDKKPETSDNNLASWDAFADSFLPAPVEKKPSAKSKKFRKKNNKVALLAQDESDTPEQQILKWNAGSGLQNPNSKAETDKQKDWIVDVMFYSFNINSAIPINSFKTHLDKTETNFVELVGSKEVGVRPMGFTGSLEAPISFKIVSADQGVIDLKERQLLPESIIDNSPAALWSQAILSKSEAPDGEKMLVSKTLVGTTITAKNFICSAIVDAFPISRLDATEATPRLLPYALTIKKYDAPAPLSQEKAFTQIKNSIMSSDVGNDVVSTRNEIYSALANIPPFPLPTHQADIEDEDGKLTSGKKLSSLQKLIIKSRNQVAIHAPLSPDLSIMATAADLIFQVFPIIAPIGVYQNKGKITPAKSIKTEKNKKAKTTLEHRPPELVGYLRRHKPRSSALKSSRAIPYEAISARWTDKSQIQAKTNSLKMAKKDLKSFEHWLYDGGAYVWKLDDQNKQYVNLDGDMSAVAFCFDQFDNLLEKIQVRQNARTKLCTSTAQVAILAHEPSDHKRVGWRLGTKVTKINSKWAMVDGCLICVQNAQRVKLLNKRKQRGVIRVERLLSQNKVLNEHDELEEGWIQTTLFTSHKMIGIILDRPEKNLISVSAIANQLPTVLNSSELMEIKPLGDSYLHIYSVEQTRGEKQTYAGIMMKSEADNVKILGMHSIARKSKKMSFETRDMTLSHCGLDLETSGSIRSSKLAITS